MIDGTTKISVFKSKPRPTRKRKGGQRKKKVAGCVKPKNPGMPKTVKPSTGGPVGSTISSSACSFKSSISPRTTPPLATAESGPQDPIVDLFAPAQYASANDRLHYEPAMPNPNVAFGTTYAPDNPFQPNPDRFDQEVVPFVHEQVSMETPMACPTPYRNRAPLRNGGVYHRRPTSMRTTLPMIHFVVSDHHAPRKDTQARDSPLTCKIRETINMEGSDQKNRSESAAAMVVHCFGRWSSTSGETTSMGGTRYPPAANTSISLILMALTPSPFPSSCDLILRVPRSDARSIIDDTAHHAREGQRWFQHSFLVISQ
ncbi:MAG: hypothetical protein Q9224_000575 [Gallowayella concinna]